MKIASQVAAVLFLLTLPLFPHGQGTHQYIVREAFKLLAYEKPQMYHSTLNDYIGTDQIGSKPFDYPFVVTGAYREDEEDIVYGHCNLHLGIPYVSTTNCMDKLNTHFWSADHGDNAQWPYGGTTYDNAFTKAKHYLLGTHTIIVYTGASSNRVAEKWSYSSLADLCDTGGYSLHGYWNILGQFTEYNPPLSQTLSEADRKKYAYNILGRACHLLGDMGVPAHCHNDAHCPLVCQDGTDTYEDYMNVWTNYSVIDYVDAYNDGGGLYEALTVASPIRYLFYSMNQYSDFYPSDSHFENDTTGRGAYTLLDSIIQSLGTPPSSINCSDQRNHLFKFVIRATAGLLYYFADEADDVPDVDVNYTSSGSLRKNEVWNGNHTVTGDVVIPLGKTLHIAPGATISIAAGKKIIVYGALKAQGRDSELITLDRSGTSNWYGIKFENSSDDSECILENCVIKHCSYAVYCNQASPTIKNCEISFSMVGLYGYYYNSLEPVEGNLFKLNSLYGALLSHPQTIVMFDNDLYNYGTNIKCYYCDYSTTLRCNDIYESGGSAQGILFDHSNPVVIENMIYNNHRYGVNCINTSNPEFVHYIVDSTNLNNVIAENAVYGIITDATSLPKLHDLSEADTAYNSIYDNRGQYDIYNGNATSIPAQGNWWGQNPPNTARFYGGVDYTNPLSEDPNPTAPNLSKSGVEAIASASTSGEVNKEAREKFDFGYKYELGGEWQKAINEYDVVVDKYPATIEAKMALVHTGICYDKLGLKELKNSTFTSVASEKSGFQVGGLADLLGAAEDGKKMRFEDALLK